MHAATAHPTSTGNDIGGTLATGLVGGVAALIVWEIFARGIAPFWIGGPLEPAGLVQAVFASATVKDVIGNVGLTKTGAEALHYLTGLVFYPLGYLMVARPLARIVTPFLPWWSVAAVYGAALWVFALYVMAHLVVGWPPFLGFGQLTWASLVGHVAFGAALGAVVRARLGA